MTTTREGDSLPMREFLESLKAIREHWRNLQACADQRERGWIGDELEAELDGLIDEMESAITRKH